MAVSTTPQDLIPALDTDWAERARENTRRANQNDANLKSAVEALQDAPAAVRKIKQGATTYSPDGAGLVTLPSGVVAPATTSAERDAIVSPTVGQLIYNTTVGQLQVYTATGWGPATGVRSRVSTSFTIAASTTFVNPAAEQTYTVPLGVAFRTVHVQIKSAYGGVYGIATQTLADAIGVGAMRQYTSNDGYKTFANVGVASGALLNETGVNSQNWTETVTSLQLVGTNLVIKSSRYFTQGSIPSTTVSVALLGEV